MFFIYKHFDTNFMKIYDAANTAVLQRRLKKAEIVGTNVKKLKNLMEQLYKWTQLLK